MRAPGSLSNDAVAPSAAARTSAALADALVGAVFFMSGAAGLVYEVLWTRQLALVFGVTTYAVSTVLATYMGGLALGSYLAGRRIDAQQSPLRVYALLEVGIGLYALAVPALLRALPAAYLYVHHLDLSYAAFSFLRALLAALVLLVPTTLMGATFPVLVRWWMERHGDVGRGAATLYAFNTAGAIAGCVLAGFVLIERFGLHGTTRLAAATNLALALVAALLARGAHVRSPTPASRVRAEIPAGAARLAPAAVRVVVFAVGLSGFVALSAEVLWSRALLRYLFNSTYAFTTMLAAFLGGIAAGSALFALIATRTRRPGLLFAALQAAVGLGFVVSAALFPSLEALSSWALGTDVIHSFRRAVVTMFVRAAIVLVPPAVFLGALVPLGTGLAARAATPIGYTVGWVYAVNTLGAILGSLATAFLLVPTIGMQGTLLTIVAASIVAAGAVAVATSATSRGRLAAAATFAVVLAIALGALPPDVFRRTFSVVPAATVLWYAEGATDTVGVVESWGQRTIAYEDRRGTASTSTFRENYFLGHLPMLLHPGTPRRVLHICFGVGNSLSAVAAHERLERVDNVELSPHVLDAAPFFWTNADVMQDPKVRTIIDDGRNYLVTTPETYDVILLEPPLTFTAGVINLYTREFYEAALARLAPDGLMMQWIPTGMAALPDERRLFRAFADVFPHATMWWQLDGGCALLFGSREPMRIDYQRLKRLMAEPRVARDLELSEVRNVDHLLSYFRFDEAAFAEFVRDVEPATDDHTVLDFTAPRFLGSGFGFGPRAANVKAGESGPFHELLGRAAFYTAQRRSVVPYLTDLGDESPAAVAARIEAERHGPPRSTKIIVEEQWRRW